MSQTDRIYRIDRLLRERRRPISQRQLAEELEVSPATVKRDIEHLRNMGAPIPPGNRTGGYWYDPEAPAFELPGLWFNESELYALLAAERLLEAVQPGVLRPQLGRLKGRVRELLGASGHEAATVSRRIRLQPMGARPTDPDLFGAIAGAVLAGHRLKLAYHSRHRDETTHRWVHPYRLNHYRDNWYLLAWCERAGDYRLFSLDRVRTATDTGEPAAPADEDAVDRHLGAAFGIFAGEAREWAVLRFTPEAARWAAEETWHPDQIGIWRGDRFELQVPYSDERELVMEILKYGPDCEVVAPEGLRETVAGRLRRGAEIYGK
ncbi:MAG: helix-turn-helix transcriptional regulator [Thiohalorhabdus sp.]